MTLPARSHHIYYTKTGISVTKTQRWKIYTHSKLQTLLKQLFRRPSVSTPREKMRGLIKKDSAA